MSRKRMSRRQMLKGIGLAAVGAAAAACKPQTVVIKETVIVEGTPQVVEKVVEQTVVVEAPPVEAEMVEISFMGWGGTEEDEGVRSAITSLNPSISFTHSHSTPSSYCR